MKNLKKVLALGLALVMILGMFTIASAAETKKTAQDFTDWADVEHKDAVALAVDLGIISGKPDGSFAPNDPIDRASWAKLVYYTATGDDNADAYLGTATDLVDVQGNWAESYINYIYVNEYVSGDGQGHFMPTSNITVAGGLKTMLTVLGYDAEDRGYQNTSAWMGNIMTDAKRNGLMDDVDRKNTAAVNLTRDVAAQIVYNALQANTQTPEYGRDNGESYVVKYTPGVTLGRDVFNVAAVTANVKSVNTDGTADFENISADVSDIGTTALDDKVKASAAMVGEKVTVWVKVKSNGQYDNEIVSTAVAKAASSADKTFTDGVTLAEIYTESGQPGYDKDVFVAKKDRNTKVFVDGVDKTSDLGSTLTEVAKGNTCEVYVANDVITMIKITTWTADKVTDEVETRTRNDKLQVKVPGVVDIWTDADKIDGYQGLAKDDIVLINTATPTFHTIEKVETITGKVTLKSNGKLTVDGTAYGPSGITKSTGDLTTMDASYVSGFNVKNNKDNEYELYLDKNGTAFAIDQVSGETETEVAYVILAKALENTGSWDSSYAVQAELLFTDGTTEVVTIAKYGDKKVVKTVESGKDSEQVAGSTIVASGASDINGTFVDFSVDKDGKYEVTARANDAKISQTTVDGKPAFTTGGLADSKTVFLVEKDDEYTVYTGYKTLPKMTVTAIWADMEANKAAKYVYIEATKIEGEGSDGLIFIRNASPEQDVSGNDVYEVVTAEGAEEKMALTKGAGLASIEANKLYKIDSIDSDGVATILAAPTASDATTKFATTMTAGNSVLTIDDESFEYDKDTVAVVIDLSSDSPAEYTSAGRLSLDSYKEDSTSFAYKITVLFDGTHADYVYVVRTEQTVSP